MVRTGTAIQNGMTETFQISALFLFLTALFAFAPLTSAHSCSVDDPITIAAEDAFFPYSGLYDGQLRGFAVDIVTSAFDAVDCRVTFNIMPYSRCMREVSAGRELGCFDTTGSIENRRNYIFHDIPLFFGKINVFAHPDAPPRFTSDAFKTRTFTVVRGYTYTDEFDKDPEIKKIEVDSDLQSLAMITRRRADYAVVYEKVAAFHASNSADLISPAPVPVHELVQFDLYISFTRKNAVRSEQIAAALDRGLEAIHESGTYAEIENTWDEWLQIGLRRDLPPPHWQHRVRQK